MDADNRQEKKKRNAALALHHEKSGPGAAFQLHRVNAVSHLPEPPLPPPVVSGVPAPLVPAASPASFLACLDFFDFLDFFVCVLPDAPEVSAPADGEELLPDAPGMDDEPLEPDAPDDGILDVPLPPDMPASLPVPAPVAPVALCDLLVPEGEVALLPDDWASAMDDTDAITMNGSERRVVLNVMSNSFD